mgnify:CR=1 FL=1
MKLYFKEGFNMGPLSIIGLGLTLAGTLVTALGKDKDSRDNIEDAVERHFEEDDEDEES